MDATIHSDPRHRVIREGAIAGCLGATAVAVWFFLVDILAGAPLRTPTLLGEALMKSLGWEPMFGVAGPVIVYTIFHYLVFAVAGIGAVAAVHAAHREASVLLGLLILVVAFQVGFLGFVYMLDLSLLGRIAWTQIGIANVLAALAMGAYLWRAHPLLRHRVGEGLSGR